jgi:hypothetical protein
VRREADDQLTYRLLLLSVLSLRALLFLTPSVSVMFEDAIYWTPEKSKSLIIACKKAY